MWLRILLGVFLVGHAIGHSAWFLAAFFPGSQAEPITYRGLAGDGAAPGTAARLLGLGGLAALVGFGAASVGVFVGQTWWFVPAAAAMLVSILTAVGWWNPVGVVSTMAMLGNIAVLVATWLPWVEETARLT